MSTTMVHRTSVQLIPTLLTLFCLGVVLLLLAVLITGLLATCQAPPAPSECLVITALACLLFFGSLWNLLRLHNQLAAKNTPPLLTAARLFLQGLKTTPIVAGAIIGGYLAPDCPAPGWLVGAAIAWLLPKLPALWPAPRTDRVLRGTRLLSFEQARRNTMLLLKPGELILYWSGLHVPERFSAYHYLIIGATGSGKTVCMRLLLQAVLPRIRPGSNCRAVIWDAKEDMLPILSGMRLTCDIIILNPFDARSVAWDMAKDVTTPATALQIASIIIEEERGHNNAFFTKAARDLFAAVMVALHHTRPGNWTLADVVLILSSTQKTKDLLQDVPQTRHIAKSHFERRDERTLANVEYTIAANLAYLRPIAGLWQHALKRFSLHDWIKGESILVLGNAESLRCPMNAVNRALFERITELVLSESESSTRRTWFFLDELKDMGRLDALPRLLTKGRTKGARAVLAFQTIEGLRDTYGDRLAEEVAGMPANRLALRTDSQETARWASHLIGQAECQQWSKSTQSGPNGSSESLSEHRVTQDVVLPSEIMGIPLPHNDKCYGYAMTPAVGVHEAIIDFAGRLCPLGTAPSFIPRPVEDQYLMPDPEDDETPDWSLDDLPRIRFSDEDPDLDGDAVTIP